MDEGWVTGLRVDHIDGLYDPAEYLRRLRERLPDCFIVVEKILEQQETLCPEWPVSGTTGYDFVNALGGVMVNPEGLERITAEYRQITGMQSTFADVAYEQRKRVIEQLFAGEAHSLSLHLNLLAESDRYAKDASPQELHTALVEVTACLPVYRTYTRSFQIRAQDLQHIDTAFREARQRNPHLSEAIWTFVRRVLLLDCPANLTSEQRAHWKQFVQRWQQFSGPVMAKGKEDTAFYIYNPLISMNEVGGQDQPWSVEEFHRFAETRAKCWPHALNAGTTHDTKRGEDVRARIHVLADAPDVWARSVKRWQRWNARCKRVLNGLSVPGPNEEYFIYQTLVGAWPLDPGEMETFVERLQKVLVKSWREAKLYTSWNNTDKDYEGAIAEFVATILTPVAENHFLPDFVKFQQRVAASGACLSLAQTVLRLASPGVPDIYQGAELWELSMVDPDNRRPADFAKRQVLLADVPDRDGPDLLKNWQCGSVKQYVIQKALNFRREHPEVFRTGEYIPLEAVGPHASRCNRVCASFWNDMGHRGCPALSREPVKIVAALPPQGVARRYGFGGAAKRAPPLDQSIHRREHRSLGNQSRAGGGRNGPFPNCTSHRDSGVTVASRRLLRLIHPYTDTTLPTIEKTISPTMIPCAIGFAPHFSMRSPKRSASAPSTVNRIMRVAPTTSRRRLREYCSAAAAITNAVNGKGGGASEATVSATPAFLPIFF